MSWAQLEAWLSSNHTLMLLVLSATGLVLLVATVILGVTALGLKKRFKTIMLGEEGLNIEQVLQKYGKMIAVGKKNQEGLERRLGDVEQRLALAVAGVGLVRFNAFKETGSDLSFSLALLDARQSGVVITSIFGREESRCYGKPVIEGSTSYHLSAEEKEALAEARKNMGFEVKTK